MDRDEARWQPGPGVESPHLLALLTAWNTWAAEHPVPLRSRFDPFEFPPLLPLMILGEVIDLPGEARPYDVLFRYVGSDFSTYFEAGKATRARLSDVGPPYDARWFAISDAVRAAAGPCFFRGAPYGTAYEYVAFEMLALPLARPSGEIGFILYALARIYPTG